MTSHPRVHSVPPALTGTTPGGAASPTLAQLLATGGAALREHSSSPQLDTELLLAAALGEPRSRLRTMGERSVTAAEHERFTALIARRQRGEPVAYLLGTQEFWSLVFEVTPAVLIPRPETELVIERALTHLPLQTPARVLDLATGSGAIALAIAHERPQATVVATDFSPAALEVARRNASRLQLDRVLFRAGDWFAAVPGERFTLIASNPPYIAAGDPDLEPEVLQFEPRIALIAGTSGCEALNAIVAGAGAHLDPGGWLVLEHGWQQAEAVRNLLEQAGFRHVTSHADLAGHERVTEGQWPEA